MAINQMINELRNDSVVIANNNEDLDEEFEVIIDEKPYRIYNFKDLKKLEKKFFETADINKDKKFDFKDIKIWINIFISSFLYSLSLTFFYYYQDIVGAIIHHEVFNVSFWQPLLLVAITFTYKSTKHKYMQQHIDDKKENGKLKNKIAEQKETIENNDKEKEEIKKKYEDIIVDMHNTYTNQIFYRDMDITGKATVIKAKDDISRMFIEKYEILEEILKKETRMDIIDRVELQYKIKKQKENMKNEPTSEKGEPQNPSDV